MNRNSHHPNPKTGQRKTISSKGKDHKMAEIYKTGNIAVIADDTEKVATL